MSRAYDMCSTSPRMPTCGASCSPAPSRRSVGRKAGRPMKRCRTIISISAVTTSAAVSPRSRWCCDTRRRRACPPWRCACRTPTGPATSCRHRTAAWSPRPCVASCRSPSRATTVRWLASKTRPAPCCWRVSADGSASATSSPSGSWAPRKSMRSPAMPWVSHLQGAVCRFACWPLSAISAAGLPGFVAATPS